MKLLGQRWEFLLGNHRIAVDNAYSSIWSQERATVDDEILFSSSGWMRFFKAHAEPWLMALDDAELRIVMRSGLHSVRCNVTLDGIGVEPVRQLRCDWVGPAESWPEETEWR